MRPFGRRAKIKNSLHNERCGVCYGPHPKDVQRARERRNKPDEDDDMETEAASTKLTHLGLPGCDSLCGLSQSSAPRCYDYTVSVAPTDFLWSEPDGNALMRSERLTCRVDDSWCPECRKVYLDMCIERIGAWPSELSKSGPGGYATEGDLFAIGLLPLAERLRMQANGGADPEPDEWVGIAIAYLIKRLVNWRPSRPERQRLDGAVRTIIIESIKECRRYESERLKSDLMRKKNS